MKHMMGVMLSSLFSKFKLTQFTASANNKDLTTLAQMITDKSVRPYIQKTYKYGDIPEAIGYIEAMRTQGKVAMTWE